MRESIWLWSENSVTRGLCAKCGGTVILIVVAFIGIERQGCCWSVFRYEIFIRAAQYSVTLTLTLLVLVLTAASGA